MTMGRPGVQEFVYRTRLPVSAEETYAWHLRPGALDRLMPPWEPVRILHREPIQDGAIIKLSVPAGPVRQTWVALHQDFIAGRQFRDVQTSGPFKSWVHTHRFEPDGPSACFLEDRIEYVLPLGAVGNLAAGRLIRGMLERMFRYRHAVTAADLLTHHRFAGSARMNVLVSGSTGLVGNALIPLLTGGGHEVARLVRSKARSPSKEMVHWDPVAQQANPADFAGLDAVVHLAGDPIAKGRWNDAKKASIRDSRVKATRLLCETLARSPTPPKTLVCASAIGFYGDRGDEVMTEASPAGQGFLADVCREWEAACEPARAAGIRVVNLRIGVVLSPAGGALQSMLTPFKLGVGGVIGSGKQWWSWITLDDLLGSILHALNTESLSGPVNAVAPQAVTNHDFTKTLGKVLHRPTIFPMPAFAARLALGEMADALILASTRVQPDRLRASGYVFRYPELEAGLKHVLGAK